MHWGIPMISPTIIRLGTGISRVGIATPVPQRITVPVMAKPKVAAQYTYFEFIVR
jgi:hypothetical protein